jgi:hypothetical protein
MEKEYNREVDEAINEEGDEENKNWNIRRRNGMRRIKKYRKGERRISRRKGIRRQGNRKVWRENEYEGDKENKEKEENEEKMERKGIRRK